MSRKSETCRPVTREEFSALLAFADEITYGHPYKLGWKSELRAAWFKAARPGILQQLRNDPSFNLDLFEFDTVEVVSSK